MKKYLAIIIFFVITVETYSQRGNAHDSICTQPEVIFVKKDYRQFKKASCDFESYEDGRKAKECVCEARYYTSLGDYGTALEVLKQAYAKASSEKLKFRILQSTAENYMQAGDTMHAKLYTDKVNLVRSRNPGIDK